MPRFSDFSQILFILSISGYVAADLALPRQIVINASPPPPMSSSVVPGVGFSVSIPGITGSTWTAANSVSLCTGLVNITVGKDLQMVYIEYPLHSTMSTGWRMCESDPIKTSS
jgi:hypothetical protein